MSFLCHDTSYKRLKMVPFLCGLLGGNSSGQSVMGRKGTPFPTSNLWLEASPTSDCYNARERYTTIVRGPNLNVAFPNL